MQTVLVQSVITKNAQSTATNLPPSARMALRFSCGALL